MHILTFDIEEWFHIQFGAEYVSEKLWENHESRIEANMEFIFEALDKTQQKATFFCLGWVARQYPQVLRKIDALGYEIGSHSDLHDLAYLQSPKEYKKDFESAINSIEDVVGKKVRTYRAPAFSIKEENKWAFETIIENGIEIDCSIFPAERDYGGFGQFNADLPCRVEFEGSILKELPMNSYRMFGKDFIFSGGGYFRFFPYQVISRMIDKSPYVMAYFHPRDFDEDQPMIKDLPLHRKFKSYYGLKGASGKLNKMLEDYEFMDIDSADRKIDWSKTELIKLK